MNATRAMQAALLLTTALSAPLARSADPDVDHVSDPIEPVNRAIFRFNEAIDRAVIKPLANGYKAVLPQPVRTGVANVFGNLESPIVIVNDLLQGKIGQGVHDTGRFIFNSTFGIGGIFDIATRMRLPRHQEDFGQTLAVWGVGSGPYLVAPLFGPTTLRDFTGSWTVDLLLDPVYMQPNDIARYSMIATETVDTRSRIPAAADEALRSAPDPYIFTRSAYLQRRQSLIYDGHPPQRDLLNEGVAEPGAEQGPPAAPSGGNGSRLIIR